MRRNSNTAEHEIVVFDKRIQFSFTRRAIRFRGKER